MDYAQKYRMSFISVFFLALLGLVPETFAHTLPNTAASGDYWRWQLAAMALLFILFLSLLWSWNRKLARSQAALRQSERFSRAALDALEAHLCVLDESGVIISVNRAWCEFAYANAVNPAAAQCAYAEGYNYLRVCEQSGKDGAVFAAGLRAVLEGRQHSFSHEYPCHSPTQKRWFVAHVTRFPDEGEPVRVVVMHENITARKYAEQRVQANEQYLRRLSDNLPQGAIYQVTHTAQGEVYFPYISAGIERMLGVTPAQVMADARNLHDLIEAEDVAAISAAEAVSARELQAFNHVFRQYTTRGELRWVHCRSMPYRNEDGSVCWDGIVLDITAQKQAEAELVRAREAAEAANRAKSAFLANMSHELRTPLNIILGFAQILEADASLSFEQKNMLRRIHKGGEYLLTLINDVLDLAKVEAGHFELLAEDTDIHAFFEEVRDMFKIRADSKNIDFHYAHQDLPQRLSIDAKRLRQIVINLLGNALKFTEQGWVRLHVAYTDGDLLLTVADSGSGIAATQHTQIFQPFVQVGEQHSKKQGTGLGLAITHKLITLMGGMITLASTPSQGSEFCVRLPAPALAESAAIPSRSATVVSYQGLHGAEPLRVLITDDLADNREILARLLEPLGFEVRLAESGHACLEAARIWHPDLVLMDLRMDTLDGFATTAALHRLPGLEQCPVIAVSADAFAETRQAARAAGCVDYLVKPVNTTALFALLQKHLPLCWQHAPSTPSATSGEHLTPPQCNYLRTLLKRGAIGEIHTYLRKLAASPNPPMGINKMLKLAQEFRLKEISQYLDKFYPPNAS
jgi:PAS domain S-box-containing protein